MLTLTLPDNRQSLTIGPDGDYTGGWIPTKYVVIFANRMCAFGICERKLVHFTPERLSNENAYSKYIMSNLNEVMLLMVNSFTQR